MSESLSGILDRLERVAGYAGPWKTLAAETPLLQERLDELRAREERLDDVLVVALVGGSGVGKSTLLNALAGDELAKTSEFRPCTSVPTVYHPPGVQFDFAADWKRVAGSALENLVIVDTPDSDTIVQAHRALVVEVLSQCDLIVMCADSEKYLDDATWSLLRPLQREREMVCVETKASEAPSIRDDWMARLKKEGFEVSGHFRVNSRRTFDRKVTGGVAGDDEYDFAALERFLYLELTKERIRRIKRSNTSGLLVKTLSGLTEQVASRADTLDDLEATIRSADSDVLKESYESVRKRLFAESHLWNYALGREMGLRAKGVVGTLFRLLEAARTIPARMTSWSLWPVKGSAGNRAASILTERGDGEDRLDVRSDELRRQFESKESELALAFAKAGFDAGADIGSFEEFGQDLGARVEGVLRGPARDRVIKGARRLTGWPLALALDAAPVAFFGRSAYKIVSEYFFGETWTIELFMHAATVLGIVLIVEIFLLSAAARFTAWSSRRLAARDLLGALSGGVAAFAGGHACVAEVKVLTDEIGALRDLVVEDREG